MGKMKQLFMEQREYEDNLISYDEQVFLDARNRYLEHLSKTFSSSEYDHTKTIDKSLETLKIKDINNKL